MFNMQINMQTMNASVVGMWGVIINLMKRHIGHCLGSYKDFIGRCSTKHKEL